jgi:hypothetical protein
MLTRKNTQKARPLVQKSKLSKLMECFDVNPHSSYKLTAHRGILHTLVDENRTLFTEDQK